MSIDELRNRSIIGSDTFAASVLSSECEGDDEECVDGWGEDDNDGTSGG